MLMFLQLAGSHATRWDVLGIIDRTETKLPELRHLFTQVKKLDHCVIFHVRNEVIIKQPGNVIVWNKSYNTWSM